MRPFQYARPRDVDEAVELVAADPDATRVLAGGTDLLVALRHGTVAPRVVVDLKRVEGLAGPVTVTDDTVHVPAATPMVELLTHPVVRRELPSLLEAVDTVGSIQIRHRATLAGNICNASPAADTVPPMLVHGTQVHLAGPAGTRRVRLADFLLGPRRTDLRPGEIVTAVEISRPGTPTGTAFRRMTRRRGVDLATVSLCCAVTSDSVRFAFGAVGPTAVLVTDDSGVLADPDADDTAVEAALDALVTRTSPISDVRGSREYRLAMLHVLARRALTEARSRLAAAVADDGAGHAHDGGHA